MSKLDVANICDGTPKTHTMLKQYYISLILLDYPSRQTMLQNKIFTILHSKLILLPTPKPTIPLRTCRIAGRCWCSGAPAPRITRESAVSRNGTRSRRAVRTASTRPDRPRPPSYRSTWRRPCGSPPTDGQVRGFVMVCRPLVVRSDEFIASPGACS